LIEPLCSIEASYELLDIRYRFLFCFLTSKILLNSLRIKTLFDDSTISPISFSCGISLPYLKFDLKTYKLFFGQKLMQEDTLLNLANSKFSYEFITYASQSLKEAGQ
jgi:hypothetical protein